MANILVFGGSNVYGVYDKEGGWVERLRNSFDKEASEGAGIGKQSISHLVYNLGIPSNNSAKILDRVQFDARSRVNATNIVIFDVGKNDSSVSGKDEDFNILPSVFSRNVREIIGKTRMFTENIVFLTLLPVDESRTAPVYWNKSLSYKNTYTEKYNGILKDVCDDEGVVLFDIYSLIKGKTNWLSFFEDGLHLNQKGHRVVAEAVKDYLESNKLVKAVASSKPAAGFDHVKTPAAA